MPIKELTIEELEAELKQRYAEQQAKDNAVTKEYADANIIPPVSKQMEVVVKEAEVIKLNVQPGDTLFFKFKGDDFYNDDVQRLGDRLRGMFKNNKVIVITLPKDHDVELTTLSENVTTEEEVKDCSIPTSYCNDCHCGKKEAIEGKKS